MLFVLNNMSANLDDIKRLLVSFEQAALVLCGNAIYLEPRIAVQVSCPIYTLSIDAATRGVAIQNSQPIAMADLVNLQQEYQSWVVL